MPKIRFKTRPAPEQRPCPVPHDELIDGLLGALGWFEAAYEEVCERADMGLFSPQEYVALRMITRFARRRRAPQMKELAHALGVDKGYVTRLTRSLIEERLVDARVVRHDRRKCALHLTGSGKSAADTSYLGTLFWQFLIDQFGDEAHALAVALPLLARMPNFGPTAWPVDD